MIYFAGIRGKTSLLLLYLCFSMSSLSAQSIQADADNHHSNWQQPSEGVVMAHHADNATQYGSAGLTKQGGFKPDKNTIFEIGSITKVFTSILLAEAVRENLAKFDDPVSLHLKELKFIEGSPFKSITLSELATHTSGLPRLPIDLSDGVDIENPYAHYNEQRLMQSLVDFPKKRLEKPGEYSYSNYGAGILGYVLTQIYEQTYRDLLKEKILNPLNMNSTDVPTRFTDLPEELTSRIATPHNGGKVVNHWELGALLGAGAMISSAEDLVKFGAAHWDDNIPEGLASSLSEVAKPRIDNQGLGWAIDEETLNHSGGTGGFRTDIEVNVKDKTVHIFLANSASASGEVTTEGDFLPLQGYWSGVLNTPQNNRRLVSFISDTGRMVVYSIDQDYQAVLSAKSVFVNDQFNFSFPTIEGILSGKLENGEMTGKFVQGGGQGTPITMTYSKDLPDTLREGLDKKMQGDLQRLEGYWSGYIKGKEGLFVYLKVTQFGELSILEMYSPDQHDQAISVSAASLKNGKFKFESNQINGKYSGKLSKDQKIIKGSWKQGFLPTSVTLHFSEEKPERE